MCRVGSFKHGQDNRMVTMDTTVTRNRCYNKAVMVEHVRKMPKRCGSESRPRFKRVMGFHWNVPRNSRSELKDQWQLCWLAGEISVQRDSKEEHAGENNRHVPSLRLRIISAQTIQNAISERCARERSRTEGDVQPNSSIVSAHVVTIRLIAQLPA
jgi:hypothetical protein